MDVFQTVSFDFFFVVVPNRVSRFFFFGTRVGHVTYYLQGPTIFFFLFLFLFCPLGSPRRPDDFWIRHRVYTVLYATKLRYEVTPGTSELRSELEETPTTIIITRYRSVRSVHVNT